MAQASFTIDPDGNGYKLSRTDEQGHKTEMHLSEDNVISLAQSAERLRDHIAAKYRQKVGSAHPTVVVVLVGHIELNSDIHETHLQMTLVDQNGGRSPCFALPADTAKGLYEALPEWVSKLGTAKQQH